MPSVFPILEFASLSDVGRSRLANEDACYCDQRMGLFVVCDGIGGRPSGEAAAQMITYALGHLIRRRLRQLKKLGPNVIKTVLAEAASQLNQEFAEAARVHPALVGMGATLVAVLIDGASAYVIHAGDSRAYLCRVGQLKQLTNDDSTAQQRIAAATTTIQAEQIEKGLLTQFIGMDRPLNPSVTTLPLQMHDRIMLCTDGLSDMVARRELSDLLSLGMTPARTCHALVHAANEAGGPDNITLIVLEYQGVQQLSSSALRREPAPLPDPPQGVAARLHAGLLDLEKDLQWLCDGAAECMQESAVSAFAAVKRRVGPDTFLRFMRMHPSQNPADVFHRACSAGDSQWRQQYVIHQDAIQPHLSTILDGRVRLSPILASDETATILATLWRDFRRVDQRYFTTCTQPQIAESQQTLDEFIGHMLGSIRTLAGLLLFFPRFMRGTGGATDTSLGSDIASDR